MGTQSQSVSQGGKSDQAGRAVRAAVGIDIGGTGIKGAPVDLGAGTLMAERYRLDTPHPAEPGAVAEAVGEVARHFDWSGPVGVTFPGVIVDGGLAPVLINDADAAGLAEVTHGAGRERNGVALMLTFGTGIRSALFLDGRLLPNTELGHLEIRGKDAEHLEVPPPTVATGTRRGG